MKVIGFWPAKSKNEERLLNGILGYTICVIGIALWVEATELYLGKDDFYVSIKIYNNILEIEQYTRRKIIFGYWIMSLV